MQHFSIYVAEPGPINIQAIKEALADTSYTITEGNAVYTAGNPADCDAVIIRSKARIDHTIKDKMPNLKSVVRIGTGLDTVDMDFCKQAGIAVYNAPGANAEAVADYVVTVIMMAMRNLHLLERKDLEQWDRFKFMGRDIKSQIVGIVGFGNVGRQVYHKLSGLGVTDFRLYDPFVKEAPEHACFMDLDDILASADIISLHLPLLPHTKYCVGKQNLHLLKGDAILLNASRGGIVDEMALLEEMQNKHFTYIADTVENEPTVNPSLLDHPNILITPHIASLTAGAEKAVLQQAVNNLVANKQAVVVGA
jgi:phosphoglycerate dehydrogenase-like enzyme